MKDINIKAEDAYRNYEAIKLHTRAIQANMIVLGRLFHENHSFGYYKVLGCSTWKEFLAQPDICYQESTVRSLVGIYKRYVLELKVDEDRLMNIGHYRLRLISPVVKDNPEEWLSKAEHLSLSDLIYEVKALPPKKKEEKAPSIDNIMTPEQYVQFVKNSPCCVCGSRNNVVGHHHPQKRIRTDADWKVIPLCSKCHAEYHANEGRYRHDWAKHFYGFLYGIIVSDD